MLLKDLYLNELHYIYFKKQMGFRGTVQSKRWYPSHRTAPQKDENKSPLNYTWAAAAFMGDPNSMISVRKVTFLLPALAGLALTTSGSFRMPLIGRWGDLFSHEYFTFSCVHSWCALKNCGALIMRPQSVLSRHWEKNN